MQNIREVDSQRDSGTPYRTSERGQNNVSSQILPAKEHWCTAIETVTANTTNLTCFPKSMGPSSSPQTESICIQSLIGLLNRVLEQQAQTAAVAPPSRGPVAIVQSRCRVCQSAEHSTTVHCRQANLCMGCYKPGHWKRECQQRRPRFNTHPQPQPQPAQAWPDQE